MLSNEVLLFVISKICFRKVYLFTVASAVFFFLYCICPLVCRHFWAFAVRSRGSMNGKSSPSPTRAGGFEQSRGSAKTSRTPLVSKRIGFQFGSPEHPCLGQRYFCPHLWLLSGCACVRCISPLSVETSVSIDAIT